MAARRPQRANGKKAKPNRVALKLPAPKIETSTDTERIKELKATPLGFLLADQVREILMSMCQRDPDLKKAYDYYNKFGGWDTRVN